MNNEDGGGDLFDEDLAYLETMDIDKDYNMWKSFRGSMAVMTSSDKSVDVDVSISSEDDIHEKEELRKWEQRVSREEVYSAYYKPNEREKQEINDLAILLGVSRRAFSSFFKADKITSSLLSPGETNPKSIILKRGPVLLHQQSNANIPPDQLQKHERELILLTQGFILATIQQSAFNVLPKKKKKVPIRRKVEFSQYLTSILSIQDHTLISCPPSDKDDPQYHDTAFSITLQQDSNHQPFTFVCSSTTSKHAWIRALSQATIKATINSKRHVSMKTGWQHAIVQTSVYSAAYNGDAQMLERILDTKPPKDINAKDDYNHFSALHYAAYNGHKSCVRLLLEKGGANPNSMNQDMRTPFYYAQLNKHTQVLKILQNHGAIPDHADLSSELYGAAKAQDTTTHEKINTTKVKAEAASNHMSEAMNQLRERGEKLETMDSKTKQLKDDAKEFQELTKQLKEKMKKESTGWFGF